MSKFFRFSLLFLVVTLIVSYFLYRWAISSVDPQNQASQIFVVPPGQPASTIGRRLQQQGFIKSDFAFQLLLNRYGVANQLQAGDFRLSPSQDLETIIKTLAYDTLDYWLTFPEGLRVEEYADKLLQKSEINPQDFILTAKPHEGQLFPDTYLIPYNASSDDIVNLLLDNFSQKSPTQDKRILIIASLIEREARHAQDRALVSSVIHNRLKLGMALQIDATIQYILGKSANWWPQNLSSKDLKTPSPYNTYLNSGLPPKPIANPGLASIKAALNPANSDYFYYVSDSTGYNHYAETLEGHRQNIDKYLK